MHPPADHRLLVVTIGFGVVYTRLQASITQVKTTKSPRRLGVCCASWRMHQDHAVNKIFYCSRVHREELTSPAFLNHCEYVGGDQNFSPRPYQVIFIASFFVCISSLYPSRNVTEHKTDVRVTCIHHQIINIFLFISLSHS